jgi:hypothetical protein
LGSFCPQDFQIAFVDIYRDLDRPGRRHFTANLLRPFVIDRKLTEFWFFHCKTSRIFATMPIRRFG